MSTATVSEEARRYLDAVRDGLADALTEEDADEVLQDLEAHLAEIDADEIEVTLGRPEDFIAEFRSSAGLDDPSPAAGGRLARIGTGVSDAVRRNANRFGRTLEPLLAPLIDRRSEIQTAWIWSRGILAVLAFSWASSVDTYGVRSFLSPMESNLVVQLAVLALATFASVRLGAASGTWWRRASLIGSLGVGFLILVAVTTNHYVNYPEEQAFYSDYGYSEAFGPGMLIGPDGPIQNVYAYDVEGNPVEVLLYDEHGNPLLTLPGYAYDQSISMSGFEPFIWEGFEIVFREDKYGRPIGNLFPLERYDWTQNGARSAPQPPPVVGIPEIPRVESDAGQPEADPTPTTAPAITTTPGQSAPVEIPEPSVTTTTQVP